MNDSESVFSYQPETELDYGTLMCWARNKVGEQRKPCVFHIIAAGRPDNYKVEGFNIFDKIFGVSLLLEFKRKRIQKF